MTSMRILKTAIEPLRGWRRRTEQNERNCSPRGSHDLAENAQIRGNNPFAVHLCFDDREAETLSIRCRNDGRTAGVKILQLRICGPLNPDQPFAELGVLHHFIDDVIDPPTLLTNDDQARVFAQIPKPPHRLKGHPVTFARLKRANH